MLLKDLVKHTWEDHPDHANLLKTLKKMEEIAFHLNEMKRRAENYQNLTKVKETLTGKNIPVILHFLLLIAFTRSVCVSEHCDRC